MNIESLSSELKEVLNTKSFLVNASQFSAFIYENINDLNWAGFYFLDQGQLILGPFQGKLACSPIAIGKGVCGACIQRQESIIVADVHQFPGHIACDSASNSELVVPLFIEDKCIGLFDLDSPIKNRFTEKEKSCLEQLLKIFVNCTDFSDYPSFN